MYDVVALGELLVDFIQNGSSEKGRMRGIPFWLPFTDK